ncbi:MAG: lipopolysaccharide biosynthesis protein [Ruminococcus sp.]|nr:lipopolysaccharide biosynthesis protein [Ruminococcus sp.]
MEDNKNVNIILKNEEDDKDSVVLSFSTLIRMFRKFLAVWVALAVLFALIGGALGAYHVFTDKDPVRAKVSFTYSGIEKGLDPSGKKFDVHDIKNPTVVERALTALDMDLDIVDDIRNGISISGQIPENAWQKMSTYKNVMETATSGNLAAAQAMLETQGTINPTIFNIHFDYSKTGLSRSKSVEVLNRMLDEYSNYFYEKYGFNEMLGTSVPAVDSSDYDYSEQIDIFENTLTTLTKYVKNLSNEDTNLFRSIETGYTFNDLYRAAQTISDIDLDRISSYITVNNLTKDKDASIAYYDYRIDALTRSTTALQDRLNTIENSIENYEKDTILIFGNGTDGNNTSYSQASDEYDTLIKQRVNTSTELAETKQRIKFYETRKSALKNNRSGTKAQAEKVEADLAKLSDKVIDLVKLTEITADEYYENVQYKNAYNVIVPATADTGATIKAIINAAKKPLILLEGALVFVYFAVVFVKALIADTTKSGRSKKEESEEKSDDKKDKDKK